MPSRTELNELYSVDHELKQVKARLKNALSNLRVVNATVARVCSDHDELQAKLTAREADILDLTDQFRAKLDTLQAKLVALEGKIPQILLTEAEIKQILSQSDLLDMFTNIGWYSAPASSFVKHGMTLIRQVEAKLYAAAGAAPATDNTFIRGYEVGTELVRTLGQARLAIERGFGTDMKPLYRENHKAGAAPVPKGWQLVPVVATEDMLYAIQENCHILPQRGRRVWAQLLAAAPKGAS